MNRKIIIAFLLALFACGITDAAHAANPKKKKAKKHAVKPEQASSATEDDNDYQDKKISP